MRVNSFQHRCTPDNIEIFRIRTGTKALAFEGKTNVDQAVGIGDAYRIPEQECIRQSKDCRVCANADRKCNDGGQRKQSIALKLPQAIPEVLSKILKQHVSKYAGQN